MNTMASSQHATTTVRIHTIALANAAAIVGAISYALCVALAALAPGLYLALFQSWAHGLGVATLQAGAPPLSVGSLIAGLVTFVIAVWLATAAVAVLYNRIAR
jgi:hypothetical protein